MSKLAVLVVAAALAGCGSSAALSPAVSLGPPPTGAAARPGAGSTAGNLTTYHYDNARSGDDTVDPVFTKFRPLWTDRLIDGAVYAEPLVWHGEVVVATEDDLVYGLDARNGHVMWRTRIGRPVPSQSLESPPGPGCGDIFPLGITGTPVIDISRGELFAAGEVQDPHRGGAAGVEHVLAAVRLSSGRLLWERRIDPPGAGRLYQVAALQQRSALSLVSGRVVVELGGLFGDCGDYHGYVESLPESRSGRAYTYRVPTAREGAIWAVSGAVSEPSGKIYVATGNGSSTTRFDYGDSVIDLSRRLRPLGFFAPRDWAALNAGDLDLGAGGPILLRSLNLIFESGKVNENGVNVGYLLDPSRLGGIGHPRFSATACPGNGNRVFGAFASATELSHGRRSVFLYVPCVAGTTAFVVSGGRRPSFRRVWTVAKNDPNGPPIVAGGLVWALSTGNDGGAQSNLLTGMRPTTGRVVVTEQLGDIGVVNFATPAVGDRRLFVAGSKGVAAFGD